ncbi:MAG: CRISPR-associated endonuclease Cas2 [Candidatus Levybacteria bacterium RBG_16_35_6]|nr:MAG: CRISPR-associated endonuclease Cas2 [Candidatus Levybacteria bacterium RBG_16_35_6]
MAKRVRRSSYGIAQGITKGLLIGLGAGAVITVALVFPGIGQLYKAIEKEKWEQAKKRGALQSTIRRLKKQELVSWREVNGKLTLNLTEKGKKKVLTYKIDELKLKEQTKWDKMWRVIIFDIPEKNRSARDVFREKLKDLNFYQLQKSVFVTRLECREEIDFLKNNLGIAQYVHYILGKEVESIA